MKVNKRKTLPGTELVEIVKCKNCFWSKKAQIEGEKGPMVGTVFCTLHSEYGLKSSDWFCPLGIPHPRLMKETKE
jgi:hypothetical protein